MKRLPIIFWVFLWLFFTLSTILIFSKYQSIGLYLLVALCVVFGVTFIKTEHAKVSTFSANSLAEISEWLDMRHPFITYAFIVSVFLYIIFTWTIRMQFSLFSFMLYLTVFCLLMASISLALFLLTVAGYSKSKRELEKKKKFKVPGEYTFRNIPAYCVVGIGMMVLNIALRVAIKPAEILSKHKRKKYKRSGKKKKKDNDRNLSERLCKKLGRMLSK
jgi:hypothetical protein